MIWEGEKKRGLESGKEAGISRGMDGPEGSRLKKSGFFGTAENFV